MTHLPILPCLPLNLSVFEGILDQGSARSSENTGGKDARLKSERSGNFFTHCRVVLLLGEGKLESGELRRSVKNRAPERWDPTSVETDSSFCLQNVFHCRDILDGFTHMLTLCLHLCLDRVKRMPHNCVGRTIQETADCRTKPLVIRG